MLVVATMVIMTVAAMTMTQVEAIHCILYIKTWPDFGAMY